MAKSVQASIKNLAKTEQRRSEAIRKLEEISAEFPDLIYALAARICGLVPFDDEAEENSQDIPDFLSDVLSPANRQRRTQLDSIRSYLNTYGPSTRADIVKRVGEKAVKNCLRQEFFHKLPDGRWANDLR